MKAPRTNTLARDARPGHRRRRAHARSALAILALGSLGGCALTVDTTADRIDADLGDGVCADAFGQCTLRAAVGEAHASVGAYRIVIPAGTYVLDLPQGEGGGSLQIPSNMVLQGAGSDLTTIETSSHHSLVLVTGGDEVGQAHLRRRRAAGASPTAIPQFGGGLNVHDADVELFDVRFENNRAFTGGGALSLAEDADVFGEQLEFVGNSAVGAFGGAVFNDGRLVIHDSLFTGNTSNRAGALHNDDTGILNLYNVTVSGNEGEPERSVGGIMQNGFAVLRNVTIANNTGGQQGAVEGGGGLQTVDGKITVLKNSLIANNTLIKSGLPEPSDCVGPVSADSRYNLIEAADECDLPALLTSYVIGQDPQLGALAANGGATRTHRLLAGSPAIDAGFPFPPGTGAADACRARDQRGVPRPQTLFSNTDGGICDLGAYEAGNLNAAITRFVLVDADTDTDTDIGPLRTGDVLLTNNLPDNLSVRAESSGGPIGSVVFDLDDTEAVQIEHVAPYALAGDAPAGDYHPFAFESGEHRLTATPYQNANGSGSGGFSRTVRFRIF